jgi:MFS family permease
MSAVWRVMTVMAAPDGMRVKTGARMARRLLNNAFSGGLFRPGGLAPETGRVQDRVMSLVALLREQPRLIAFGLLFCFGSSLGQTFFISFFVPGFMQAFGLSQTGIAGVYAGITIAAAAGLAWAGRHIDRMDLSVYGALVCAFLGAGCFLLAGSWGLPALVAGLFMVRLGGQGLMSHVGMTAVARYFAARRGAAIALAALGFPLGEILLPLLTVGAIETLGWRWTYALGGLALVLGVLPLALWLVRGEARFRDPAKAEARAKARGETLPDADGASEEPVGVMSAKALWRSPLFLALAPAYVAAPFAVTALIFHQSAIAAERGVGLEVFAGSFVLFGAAQIVFGTAAGPLADRFTARALFPLHLAPFAAGAALLALVPAAWAVPAYMTLMGISSGFSATLRTALIAELVRPMELGAARSSLTALMVLSTALGPVAYGGLLALGQGSAGMLWATVALTLVCSLVAMPASDRRMPG